MSSADSPGVWRAPRLDLSSGVNKVDKLGADFYFRTTDVTGVVTLPEA
ncbi:hypothetical protein [Saccharopolyspora rhizosphaerae]|nr:hypothetical protein [Saccharopolyspora rhizosphaerae]